jgi:hypothetical protein
VTKPTVAFALRAEYEGTTTQTIDGENRQVPVFSGGLVAAGDRDVDIAELLDDGDGQIVVAESDVALLLALDQYPALKRVGADDEAAPVNPYLAKSISDLRAEAKRRDLEVPAAIKKPALAEALLEHDRELAAGGPDNTDPEASA